MSPIACVADAAAVIVADRGAEVGVGFRQPNKEADVEAILRIVFQVTTRNIIRRHCHHWRSSRERDSSQSNWRRRSDASNSQDNSSCSSQLKWSELQPAKLWMYMWQFPATIAGFSFVLCCVVLSLVRVAGARPRLQACLSTTQTKLDYPPPRSNKPATPNCYRLQGDIKLSAEDAAKSTGYSLRTLQLWRAKLGQKLTKRKATIRKACIDKGRFLIYYD